MQFEVPEYNNNLGNGFTCLVFVRDRKVRQRVFGRR